MTQRIAVDTTGVRNRYLSLQRHEPSFAVKRIHWSVDIVTIKPDRAAVEVVAARINDLDEATQLFYEWSVTRGDFVETTIEQAAGMVANERIGR